MRRGGALEATCELLWAFQDGFPKRVHARIFVVEDETLDASGIQQGEAQRGASGKNLYEGVQLLPGQPGIQVINELGLASRIGAFSAWGWQGRGVARLRRPCPLTVGENDVLPVLLRPYR